MEDEVLVYNARVDEQLSSRQRALVAIGDYLRGEGYQFVTPTPETHRRVNERPPSASAKTVRDVFGWSRPFHAGLLPDHLLSLCNEAKILLATGERDSFTSAVRFSTLSSFAGSHLFVHSAYPTTQSNAVFFGPDSYRFAALLARTVWKAGRLIDVGCGTGVGGLVLASRADEVVLSDINADARAFAAVNVVLAAGAAGTGSLITVQESDVLAQVQGPIDAVIANPPYIADDAARVYRDGGGALGIDLAARIVRESLERLSPGGQLVLYTGTPVIDGRPVLQPAVEGPLRERSASWTWEEMDPDVFGEELARPAYLQVERIAVVALTATVP